MYASSAWFCRFTIAYFPSPTGLAASPFLNSSDNSSFVCSFGSLNIPPTLAQYLSELLASVFLISGSDFLPMTNNLYNNWLLSFCCSSLFFLQVSNHKEASNILYTLYFLSFFLWSI